MDEFLETGEVRPCVPQKSSQSTIDPYKASAKMEGSTELAAVLGVDTIRSVRTTGQGRDKRFSLIDAAALVSGRDPKHASEDVKHLLSEITQDSEVTHVLGNLPELLSLQYFQFPGQGQRPTPVGDLRLTLYVMIMQRSRNAKKLAFKAIDVLVRYLGGDPELTRELIEEFRETGHVRPCVPQESSQSTIDPYKASAKMEGSTELAALLGVDTVRTVRTTGQGRDKRFSLIDAAALVSGKSVHNSAEDIRKLLLEVAAPDGHFPEVVPKEDFLSGPLETHQFPGQGQRPTPVGDLRLTLYVMIMQRSRNAKKLAFKAIDVLVRYLGGDPELAKETMRMRGLQEHLQAEDPTHPLRAFGEDVESSTVQPDRSPVAIFGAEGFDCGDHTYVFHTGLPGILKIGRAADVNQRKDQVQRELRKIDVSACVHVLALWKFCGVIEKHLHRHMLPRRAEVGKLTEYYKCELQEILDAFPSALAAYNEELALCLGGDERMAKRRRLEDELDEAELREKHKLKLEDLRREAELKLERSQREEAELRENHKLKLERSQREEAELRENHKLKLEGLQREAQLKLEGLQREAQRQAELDDARHQVELAKIRAQAAPRTDHPDDAAVKEFIATRLAAAPSIAHATSRGAVQDALSKTLTKVMSRVVARKHLLSHNLLQEATAGQTKCYSSTVTGAVLRLV